jgi:methylated-DNA-[protein]-cysteine S-methyltransferase
MKPCYVHQFPTPIRDIFLALNSQSELILLYFMGPRHPAESVLQELRSKGYGPERNEEATEPAVTQIREYFDGKRKEFSLALAPQGTPFQQRVWKELLNIPHGAAISYGELAARVGNPKASRAVGAANGQNPISLIIPCHRVIGSDKSLTGYGGGLNVKEALLKHEGVAFKHASDKKARQTALTFA